MDRNIFERIVSEYLDCIFRVAVNSCNSKEDAEDAVQNSFAKLWKCGIEFVTDEDAKRWLIRVVINECRSMWRLAKRKNEISFEDIADEPAVNDTYDNNLFNAIQTLQPKYRQVLYLYYYEGYKVKEIAEMTGASETSVQTRLMRARRALKDELKDEER